MFAVSNRRTSLRIDSGQDTIILNEVKNLVRKPGVENRCGVPDPSLTLRMTERTFKMTKGRSGTPSIRDPAAYGLRTGSHLFEI